MMWYRELIANNLWDNYGHWMEPDGDMHDVNYQDHEGVIDGLGFRGYEHAFREGLIRIVNSDPRSARPRLSIEIPQKGISYNQMLRLQRLISQEYKKYRGTGLFKIITQLTRADKNYVNNPNNYKHDYLETDDFREAIDWLQKYVQSTEKSFPQNINRIKLNNFIKKLKTAQQNRS